jgi:hypothetical protein
VRLAWSAKANAARPLTASAREALKRELKIDTKTSKKKPRTPSGAVESFN